MATYYLIYKFGLMRYLLGYFGAGETITAALTVIGALICIVSGYLLGGLNFAIIISKKKFGVDVRDFGSGNAGMTNMHRTFGKKAGVITLVGDMGKAIVACLIGYLLLGLLGAYIAGLFCILGHMFPVKYKFKGGKGVASTAAVILMTTAGDPRLCFIPVVFFIVLACFIVIVLGSKFISLGSIISVLIYPLILNAFQQINIRGLADSIEQGLTDTAIYELVTFHREDGFYIIIAITIMVLVVFMHRSNIKRLWEGKENKFSLHSKKTLYEEKLEKDSSDEQEKKPLSDKPDPNTSKKKKSKK